MLRIRRKKENINSRKYGQVKLRASKRGIYACLFALGGTICQGVMIYVAYVTYGEAPAIVGSIALVAVMNAVLGINYGIQGFREREKNYTTCKVGIVLNVLLIILYIMMFVRGLS